ncbi:MAG: hypothetical protein EBZ48_02490 [Proteobacteria bacterium]|nr:hypothetical protein [Pseudomonadota bacterium]
MVESSVKCKFKEKDRVRRVAGVSSLGTVKEVRFELENSGLSEEARQRGAMIGVQWDSGTLSYFAPDALEIASE